jgi:membrane-bound lytic murein transglycosylase D
MRVVALVAATVLLGLGSAHAPPAHAQPPDKVAEELEALRGMVSDLADQMARMRPGLHSFRIPDALAFAGVPVPLDRWDVGERLEREFYLTLADPAQVVLWLKRSARYFPYIEARLREAGLPDDLKYVAVAESALRPTAYSWARASGIWQFIDGTARRYGLRVSDAWDERRDPERATTAAIAYLRDLHARFRDWPLALAAYNAGEHRVETALDEQDVAAYYQLALPKETERYVFRVLAAKLILEAPDHYGFQVPAHERYAPHATETVSVTVSGHLLVRELASAVGSFYRELRTLNPALAGDHLPPGTYTVRVPEGGREPFAKAWPGLERAMAARAVRRVKYRVRRGDTLGSIARRFGVSVDTLRDVNAAARRAHLYPGQILVIERAGTAE